MQVSASNLAGDCHTALCLPACLSPSLRIAFLPSFVASSYTLSGSISLSLSPQLFTLVLRDLTHTAEVCRKFCGVKKKRKNGDALCVKCIPSLSPKLEACPSRVNQYCTLGSIRMPTYLGTYCTVPMNDTPMLGTDYPDIQSSPRHQFFAQSKCNKHHVTLHPKQ